MNEAESQVNEAKNGNSSFALCVLAATAAAAAVVYGKSLMLVSNDIKCPERPSHQNYICHIFGIHSEVPQRNFRMYQANKPHTMHLSERYLDSTMLGEEEKKDRKLFKNSPTPSIPLPTFFLSLPFFTFNTVISIDGYDFIVDVVFFFLRYLLPILSRASL